MKWLDKDPESIEADLRKLIREEIDTIIREKNLEVFGHVFAETFTSIASPDDTEKNVSRLRVAAQNANQKLYSYVSELCPGEHILVQHRDGRSAWCEACGRSKDGILVDHDDKNLR